MHLRKATQGSMEEGLDGVTFATGRRVKKPRSESSSEVTRTVINRGGGSRG